MYMKDYKKNLHDCCDPEEIGNLTKMEKDTVKASETMFKVEFYDEKSD